MTIANTGNKIYEGLSPIRLPSKKQQVETPLLDKIYITEKVYQKSALYSDIIQEITGLKLEWNGILLTDPEREDTISTDITLRELSEISAVDATGEIPYEEIRRTGKKINGIIHYHGIHNCFPSSLDDGSFKVMYEKNKSFSIINRNRLLVKKVDYDNSNLFKISANNNSVEGRQIDSNYSLEVILDESLTKDKSVNELIKEGKIRIKQKEYFEREFSQSLIFGNNSFKDRKNPNRQLTDYEGYYGEIKIEKQDKKGEFTLKHVNIVFVDEGPFELNEIDIVNEVGNKVFYKNISLKSYPNFKKVLDKYTNLYYKKKGITIPEKQDGESQIEDKINESYAHLTSNVPKEAEYPFVNIGLMVEEPKKKNSQTDIFQHSQKSSEEQGDVSLPYINQSVKNLEDKIESYPKIESPLEQTIYKENYRPNYKSLMYRLYDEYSQSNDPQLNNIANLSRILIGDYHVNGKRVWYWEDRIKEFKKEFDKCKYSLRLFRRSNLNTLFGILRQNKHLAKKHPEIILELEKSIYGYDSLTDFIKTKSKILYEKTKKKIKKRLKC